VACVEELQSLVTHLIYFTHRKIQVTTKPSVVLQSTKMSFYELAFCLLWHCTCWSCRDPCFGLQYAVDQNCNQWPMVWSG